LGNLQRQRTEIVAQKYLLGQGLVDEGLLKQPQLELQPQHTPCRIVHNRFGHQSFLHQLGQVSSVRPTHHVDIHARQRSQGVATASGEVPPRPDL